MKKSIVSVFVFLILTAGFQARAQESAVDNGVVGVENENDQSAISDYPIYKFNCTENNEGSIGKINVQYFPSGNGNLMKVVLKDVSGLEKQLQFITEENAEHSFLYDTYSYELVDQSKNAVGELTVSKKAPGVTRGGFENCGRAGCFAQPNFIYKGLLKIYEKEISFTCK